MNIYLENGYLDVETIRSCNTPFIFITSARGLGKTYGFIKSVIDRKERFIFMRRTQTQIDTIKNPAISPFKKVCQDLGIEYDVEPLAKGVDSVIIGGEHQGYMMALSTMANVRGFDDPQVTVLIYDEFIPEPHERLIKEECTVFLNAYETLNRNRELSGEKPIQLLAASNSNSIINPIYTGLKLVERVDKMIKSDREVYIDRGRGLMLVYPMHSPISKQKAGTALYKLSGEGKFSSMALNNDFNISTMGTVRPMNLKELIPLVTVGELTFYVHKSDAIYYCTTHRSGGPPTYKVTDEGLSLFRAKYDKLWVAYCFEKMFFEKYMCEALYRVYMGKRS